MSFRFNKEQDTLEEIYTPISEKGEEEENGKNGGESHRKKEATEKGLTKDGKSSSVDDVHTEATASPRSWRQFKERVQQAVEDIKTPKSPKDDDSDSVSEESLKDEISESSSILDKFKSKRRSVLSKLKKENCSPYKSSSPQSSKSTIKEDKPHEELLFDTEKLVEIESGIEMVEDMVFVASVDDLPLVVQSTPRPLTPPPPPSNRYAETALQILRDLLQKESFVFALLASIVTYVLRLSPFWQGSLLTLFVILVFRNICDAIKNHTALVAQQRKMSEAPPADEARTLKTYSGWMNQVDKYTPEFYHVSDAQSVFVAIEGSVLRLSYTKAKISKRHLWNDKTKKKIHFYTEKLYDLTEAVVQLWPHGLARKRYFSRKYPIKITIAAGEEKVKEETRFKDSFEEESDNEKTDSQVSSRALDTDVTITDNDLDFKDCIEDTRESIFLFARCDREKEDWLRRLLAASRGDIYDKCEPQQSSVFKCDNTTTTTTITDSKSSTPSGSPNKSISDDILPEKKRNGSGGGASPGEEEGFIKIDPKECIVLDNIVMPGAARASPDFIQFLMNFTNKKENTEHKQRDGEPPSDSSKCLKEEVVWANLVVSRVLYGIIHDSSILAEIHTFLQKKLSAIKLPHFMEEVCCTEINLGSTPPLIHKIYTPFLDERGIWIDADITYEGLASATISTKLNLMRLRKQETGGSPIIRSNSTGNLARQYSKSAPETIYDSDAESTGESSSESDDDTSSMTESIETASSSTLKQQQSSSDLQQQAAKQKKKRLLRIVNKITTSNIFQSATEIPYIQRAMENMSTNLKLRVELKGLTARVVVNLPSPPSDRCWLGFREPPRLLMSAKPTVGETKFDWSIVTSAIENKMCDEIYKYLVYPNLVDVIIPVLGQPMYRE